MFRPPIRFPFAAVVLVLYPPQCQHNPSPLIGIVLFPPPVSVLALFALSMLSFAANKLTSRNSHQSQTTQVVSTLGLYGSAQVGSVSDTYLHLPILSVGGTRGAGGDGEGTGGYLLHVQPALVPQMKALVRLILDMKLARDAVDGR